MAGLIRDSGKLIRFDQVDTFEGSKYGSHPEQVAALESDGKTLRGEFERNLRELELWQYVNPIVGDSVAVAATYEDESLDFVFIDGDHRYEHVKADIEAWWPKVKPGGYIGGHDSTNEHVMSAVVEKFSDDVLVRAMTWWEQRSLTGARQSAHLISVTYPHEFPGVPPGYKYLLTGFRSLGCDVTISEELTTEGYWSPPGKLGEPIHIAPIDVNGERLWYDCSDFTECFCFENPPFTRLEPYFKKQCPGRGCLARPLGQYLNGATMDRYFSGLAARRIAEGSVYDGLAVFSNIDELHNPPLRRELVTHFRARKWFCVGLWRWAETRPEVPVELDGASIHQPFHWDRIATAKLCYALPGVGGDFTRTHTEIMGIGSCLVTIKTEQLWPGNWRNLWVELERDLSDLDSVTDALLRDDAERKRRARLGMWYFDANLRPEKMAERVLKACA
jgi:hypothetical protein